MRRIDLTAFLIAGALLLFFLWLSRSALRFYGSAILVGLVVGWITVGATW